MRSFSLYQNYKMRDTVSILSDGERCWDKTPFDSISQKGRHMKLAVISDLHGNYYALAKVLAFLRSQEIDGIIGLGDFVTDGPFPQRMMRVLREMQEEFPRTR